MSPNFRTALLGMLAATFCLAASPSFAADSRNLAIKQNANPAIADKRVALVIGNGAYTHGPLKNPVNDATDIAAKLRSLGFDVVERNNLKTSEIGRTLREFRSKLSNGAVALFFYAGHGLQIKGENYLPTVNAEIEGEEDVPNQSIAVRQVLDLLDDARTRLNLVILDACRNNPYKRRFRSADSGLARQVAPSGTLISFATRPGSVAADGAGRNGLFTSQLLAAIDEPNTPVEQLLKRVASSVKSSSKGQQEPWTEGSIEGDFYFLTRAEADAPADETDIARAQQEAIDRAVQEAIRRSSEQAAKERAELQVSMARIVQEALEKQNLPEVDTKPATAIPSSASALAPTPAKTPAAPVAASPVARPARPEPPQVIAAIAPTLAPAPAAATSIRTPTVGDEWEYQVRDDQFGKNKKLVFRVKSLGKDKGISEEIEVNDRVVAEQKFGDSATLIGVPTETEFVFGPHWDGKELPDMHVEGSSACTRTGWTCVLRAKITGREQIKIAAGTFDAVHVEGWMNAMPWSTTPTDRPESGQVSFWYSTRDGRLLKQTANFNGRFLNCDETVELTAFRPARR